MKTALYVCACILCLSLAAGAVYTAFVTLPGVRSDLRTTEQNLTLSLDFARGDLARTQSQLIDVLEATREDLAKTQADLVQATVRTETTARGAIRDLAQIRTSLDATLKQSVGTLAATTDVLQQYGKLSDKLGSTLDAATSDLQDIQASLDDLYPDLKAGIETGIVAERSIAEAAGAIEKAAPVIADAAARNVPETLENVRATSRNVKQLSGWPAKVFKVVRTGACFVPFPPNPLRFIPKLCK